MEPEWFTFGPESGQVQEMLWKLALNFEMTVTSNGDKCKTPGLDLETSNISWTDLHLKMFIALGENSSFLKKSGACLVTFNNPLYDHVWNKKLMCNLNSWFFLLIKVM